MESFMEPPVWTNQSNSSNWPRDDKITNPEQLRLLVPNYTKQVKILLSEVMESLLHQNITDVQTSLQQFMQKVEQQFNIFHGLERHMSERILEWKDEQQKTAVGLKMCTYESVSLDELQFWCEELSCLLWKFHEQLEEAEQIVEDGVLLIGNNKGFCAALAQLQKFVQQQKEKAYNLLKHFLNHSVIVERQPPPIYEVKGKGKPIEIIVIILAGNRLSLHNKTLEMTTSILCENQPARLSEIDEFGEKIGQVENGRVLMNEMTEDCKRVTFNFRKIQLKVFKAKIRNKKVKIPDEGSKQQKFCLRFECLVMMGHLSFLISTLSTPFVVRKSSSSEWIADATITWDHAFGNIDRVPFKVPMEVLWDQVGEILNAKFEMVTGGKGLTNENLYSLAKKVLRNSEPQPVQQVTWSKLCMDKFIFADPKREFTFWQWFHETLKLTGYKGNFLKDLWMEDLIIGFIDREVAETLLSGCKLGTFLLRFSDSHLGALTIAVNFGPGSIRHSELFKCRDLQSKSIVEYIKEKKCLKYLYKPDHFPNTIPKDEAFGRFYDKSRKTALCPYATVGICSR